MPLIKSWVEAANAPDCDFPLNNLPYGVMSRDDQEHVCCVAIGDQALDLAALEGAGAEVERRRENGVPYVIAIHDGIPLREGEIWAAERRMTEIALAHGFAPRGRCICDPGALPIPGSPQEMLALWDFDHQRRGSSARVQAGLEEGEARRGDPVALGLRFDGVFEWSDFAALEGALRRAGFAVLFRPSGGGIRHHVLAVMPDVTFGVEPIWTVERGATLTAIPHGFQPGGWEIVAPWPPAPGRRFMSWLRSFQVGPH